MRSLDFNPFARGVLMNPIAAAGVGVVGNLVGGLLGSSAAKKAANIQANAAQAASDKVGVAIGDANAPISAAVSGAQGGAIMAGDRVMDKAEIAKNDVNSATGAANAILNPYSSAGATAAGLLQSGISQGGDFNRMPTASDIQMDPGFTARLMAGQKILERSAAARGGAVSGTSLMGLNDYAQTQASNEYQAAFNRFRQANQDRFANLTSVANAGQQAGTTQAGNLIGAGKYGGDITTNAATTALGANEFAGNVGLQGAEAIGNNILGGARTQADLLTQKGNAQAGGIVGSTNAWTGALGGASNSIMQGVLLNSLKNPAATGSVNLARLYPAMGGTTP